MESQLQRVVLTHGGDVGIGWGSGVVFYFPKVSMRGSDLTSWMCTTRSIADMVPHCRLLEPRNLSSGEAPTTTAPTASFRLRERRTALSRPALPLAAASAEDWGAGVPARRERPTAVVQILELSNRFWTPLKLGVLRV